ncbi:unnamed protein product [Calypogeia fissa]
MDFFKKATQSLGNSGGSDLMQQAEGFMGSQNSAPATTADSSGGAALNAPPASAIAGSEGGENYSQLYGSAQTLYQGLQAKVGGGQSNVDDQQLAGAAANVLKAAEGTGYVKDSQYGEYFNKAENYLQNYGGGQQGAGAATGAAAGAAAPLSGASTRAPAAGAGAGARTDSAYGGAGAQTDAGYGGAGAQTDAGYGGAGGQTNAGYGGAGGQTDAGYGGDGAQSADQSSY